MPSKKMPPKTFRKRAAREAINGKPVVDATKALIVKIEKGDIRGAKLGSPEKCGAARAIMRQDTTVMAAHVYRSRVYVEFPDRVERYITPFRLRQETISYDRGAPDKFLEGDYRLSPPTDCCKLGSEQRKRKVGGADKRRPPPHEVAGARPRGAAHHSG